MIRSMMSLSSRPRSWALPSGVACSALTAACFRFSLLQANATRARAAREAAPNRLLHREFTIEHHVEAERLGLVPGLDVLGDALEPGRNLEDLLLRLAAQFVETVHGVDPPVADLLLHDAQVVARTVDAGPADHIGDFTEARHGVPGHLDARQDVSRRDQSLVGVPLENLFEDGAIEAEVARLLGGHVPQHLGQERLVLADDPAGLRVRLL